MVRLGSCMMHVSRNSYFLYALELITKYTYHTYCLPCVWIDFLPSVLLPARVQALESWKLVHCPLCTWEIRKISDILGGGSLSSFEKNNRVTHSPGKQSKYLSRLLDPFRPQGTFKDLPPLKYCHQHAYRPDAS